MYLPDDLSNRVSRRRWKTLKAWPRIFSVNVIDSFAITRGSWSLHLAREFLSNFRDCWDDGGDSLGVMMLNSNHSLFVCKWIFRVRSHPDLFFLLLLLREKTFTFPFSPSSHRSNYHFWPLAYVKVIISVNYYLSLSDSKNSHGGKQVYLLEEISKENNIHQKGGKNNTFLWLKALW